MRHLYMLFFLLYIVGTAAAGSSFPPQNEKPIANFALNEDDTTRYTHHYLYEQYLREHNMKILISEFAIPNCQSGA